MKPAISDFSRAIAINKKLAESHANRGVALFLQGNLDEAIKDHTRAIRLDPLLSSAYCSRGNARETKGDRSGAIDDYTTPALELKN